LQKVGKSWTEAKGLALDRTKWKGFIKALCSTYEQKEGSKREEDRQDNPSVHPGGQQVFLYSLTL
jgi:hypothetical protein